VDIFFKDTLGMTIEETGRCRPKTDYFALVGILVDGEEQHFIFAVNEPLVQTVSSLLLLEENPDQGTKNDLVKEMANIIIGRAKVEYGDNNPDHTYHLSTPILLESYRPTKDAQRVRYKTAHGCCAIFHKDFL
jgi:hypothetical protein